MVPLRSEFGPTRMGRESAMRLGLVGGLMVVGACGLFVVVGIIAATGGSVGLGSPDLGSTNPGDLVLAVALGLAGIGMGLIGLSGPSPLNGRSIRLGLGLLSVGLLSSTVSAAISSTLTYDPLENGPAVVSFLVGGLGLLVGGLLSLIGLLRAPGRPRRTAAFFLAGLLLAVVAGGLVNSVFAYTSMDTPALHQVGGFVALIGGVLMLVAFARVGLMAIDAGRQMTPRPA